MITLYLLHYCMYLLSSFIARIKMRSFYINYSFEGQAHALIESQCPATLYRSAAIWPFPVAVCMHGYMGNGTFPSSLMWACHLSHASM